MIEITKLMKHGGSLSKSISLGADGRLVCDSSACVMSAGEARRVPLKGVSDLGDIITNLLGLEAIALGALRDGLPDKVDITTKAKLNGQNTNKLIARCSDDIHYRPNQPAIVLLDVDYKGAPSAVLERLKANGGVWGALVAAVPELAKAAHLVRASTCAGIHRKDTGERFALNGGQHIYVVVSDGADVKRFLGALHQRCCLAGLGWGLVGKGGQLLERSIIDRCVFGGERLVFEGGPMLSWPLAQDSEARKPVYHHGEIINSRAVCPDLTATETEMLKAWWERERQQFEHELVASKHEYVKAAVARGIPKEAAERICKGVLTPDVKLELDEDHATVSVLDVLRDPDAYVGATLADPLEGVAYGRGKAKILRRNDGSLFVHSFAHGRAVYDLRWDARAIAAEIEAVPGEVVAKRIVELLLRAEADPIETDQLLRRASKKAGTGLNVLKQALKQAQEAASDEDENFSPMEVARALVEQHHMVNGLLALRHRSDAFYRWDTTHYREMAGEEIRGQIYHFMDALNLKPGRNRVASVREAVAAVTQVPNGMRAPAWLSGRQDPPPREIIAVQNGLLHLPTRQLLQHSPMFFGWNALPFPYDVAAPLPARWLKFLNQLWPDDPESVATLQEIFGLLVSLETRFQKAFLVLGPPGCGKGTIVRVLRALLGAENCAGPTLSGLAETFGMEALIGKQLAVISDARLGKRDQAVAVERILSLTGEDAIDIPRKYLCAHRDPLWARLMIVTNELPMFGDASGALASRFIILRIMVSFLGREDLGLTHALMQELTGIFNWSLEGYDRLMQRGYFVQPKSADEIVREFADITSPINAFVRDCCVLGPDRKVKAKDLFDAWNMWGIDQNRTKPGTLNAFGRALRTVVPELETSLPKQGGKQVLIYHGVDLRQR